MQQQRWTSGKGKRGSGKREKRKREKGKRETGSTASPRVCHLSSGHFLNAAGIRCDADGRPTNARGKPGAGYGRSTWHHGGAAAAAATAAWAMQQKRWKSGKGKRGSGKREEREREKGRAEKGRAERLRRGSLSASIVTIIEVDGETIVVR